MSNKNLSGDVQVAHLVEFCPVEVFSLMVEGCEEIEKDDTSEGSFCRFVEIAYSVLHYYNQVLESSHSLRLTPHGEEIDQKQREFCEFILTVSTRVILNSGDVASRMSCLTVFEVLLGNPKLSERKYSFVFISFNRS